MPTVAKLIFRFDYLTAYSYMDKPGTVLRILESRDDDYWDHLGEGTRKRSFIASRQRDNSFYCHLVFEPQNVVGLIETSEGIPLENFPDYATFTVFSRLTEKFFTELDISEVSRAGLRLFLFDGTSPENSSKYLHLLQTQYSSGISEILGEANDIALTLIGTADDGIEYRTMIGPYKNDDALKVFEKLKLTEDELNFGNFAISMDIDLFERNVSFKGLTLTKWSRTKWAKAKDVMTHLTEHGLR